jgi:tetratricopeptide (TPR) repeat protein
LAAIFSEGFTYYYPDSVSGFKFLGDARLLENKPDLALQEYNTALQGESSDPAYVDTLIARAALYQRQRRYDLALADLNAAFALRAEDPIRVQRMNVAYFAGDYATALSDAEALEGSPLLPADEIRLLTTRITIDQTAELDTTQGRELLRTLNNIDERRLNSTLVPVLDEYLARVHLALGNLGEALNTINRAIAAEPTFTRLDLRGRIRQARGDSETRAADKAFEYAAALQDFDFIITWSAVYPSELVAQVQERYQVVLAALIVARTPPPTPTPRP